MPHTCVYMDKINWSEWVFKNKQTNKNHEFEKTTLGIRSLEGRMKSNMNIFHCIYEKPNNEKHVLKETNGS